MKQIPVVGIDVSKACSDICILSPDNAVFASTKILHNEKGMRYAAYLLGKAEAEYGAKPVAIMEATAHYHLIFFQYLVKAGYEVVVVNPIQSGALRNINVRKIKNDKVDAHKIAMLYRLKTFTTSRFPDGVLHDLRCYCRQYMDLRGDHTAYINRLLCVLDQSFPGYQNVFSKVAGKCSLDILYDYPTPAELLNASDGALEAILRQHMRRSVEYRTSKIALLRARAEEALTIGVHFSSNAVVIRSIISILRALQEGIADLKKSMDVLINSNPEITESIALLRSIPGIGEFISVVLLAEIGDISRFKSSRQLTAYFGLDPSQRQSGKFVGTKNKISKRGSPYLRWVIALATKTAIRLSAKGVENNPVLREYYNKKRQTKASNSALCACMHKMVQYVFAVLRDRQPFELRAPEAHAETMMGKRNQAA